MAIAFGLSLVFSFASYFLPEYPLIDLDSDKSVANVFSTLLWLIVTTLAALMAKRTKVYIGWLSVAILAAFVAAGEAYDFKDTVISELTSSPGQDAWLTIVGPIAIPLLLFAGRAFLGAARSMSQRTLLVMAIVFSAAPLRLDPIDTIDLPIGIAEEGSELFAAVVLIALFVSFFGWVPIPQSLINWKLAILILGFTTLSGGSLLLREYWILAAQTAGDSPEIYHGPLSTLSQDLHVDRAFLSRIDVWAETSDGSADIFLRLAPPGKPPIRESRATTIHRRWSGDSITFTFDPVPDSGGKAWEISVGALQPRPYVFLGLSTDDPIPQSVVRVNGDRSQWSNDLALKAYTYGRGWYRLLSMSQYRTSTDVLITVEILLAWLWVVSSILWFTSYKFLRSRPES